MKTIKEQTKKRKRFLHKPEKYNIIINEESVTLPTLYEFTIDEWDGKRYAYAEILLFPNFKSVQLNFAEVDNGYYCLKAVALNNEFMYVAKNEDHLFKGIIKNAKEDAMSGFISFNECSLDFENKDGKKIEVQLKKVA